MTSRLEGKSSGNWQSGKPQAHREVRLTSDYLESVKEVKDQIRNHRALTGIKKHIDDWLWKNAHTCLPITPGSNVFLYKPDITPPLDGEISVFFAFGVHRGEESVELKKMIYVVPSSEED